ncbi:hypothetical protein LCGC14_0919940 [marine sediment metagenome]|uniref:Uncharacterized protein n=1 Tax=marine sediment metagenome TaxID=412755 RepID=A0A0F9NVZ0_9ZZZZ
MPNYTATEYCHHKGEDFHHQPVFMYLDDDAYGVYIHLYGPRGGGRGTIRMTVPETRELITKLNEQIRCAEQR